MRYILWNWPQLALPVIALCALLCHDVIVILFSLYGKRYSHWPEPWVGAAEEKRLHVFYETKPGQQSCVKKEVSLLNRL